LLQSEKDNQMQEFFSKHFFHQKRGRIGKRRSVLPWLKLQTSEQAQAGQEDSCSSGKYPYIKKQESNDPIFCNSQLCHVDVTYRVANRVTWGVNWQIDHGSLWACRIVFFKPIKTYHFKKEGPQETTH
jgi:hypothetical protein